MEQLPADRSGGRQVAKVIIENKDCVRLIGQYDRPGELFYCDPPYIRLISIMRRYLPDGFDHKGLAEALFGIKGKVPSSYNDCPYIRELYPIPAS